MIEKYIAAGVHPDVLVLSDRIVVAYGQTANQLLVLMELSPTDLHLLRTPASLPFVTSANSYPSVDYQDEVLWVAYKYETETEARGVLWNQRGDVEELGPIGNIEHPIAIGHGYLAWVGPLNPDKTKYVYRRAILGGEPEVIRTVKTSQGISHITPDGRVLLRFLDQPWGQRDVAGPLTVTDNHDNGLIVTFAGLPGFLHLFKGEQANTPRASTDGSTYAIVTWGPPLGVRLALVRPSDLINSPGGPPVAVPNRLVDAQALAASTGLVNKGEGLPSLDRSENSGRFVEHLAYQFQATTRVPAGSAGSWGLRKKTSGTRYRGHSIDGITYVGPQGEVYFLDVLSNADGDTKPNGERPPTRLQWPSNPPVAGPYMTPLVPEDVTPPPIDPLLAAIRQLEVSVCLKLDQLILAVLDAS